MKIQSVIVGPLATNCYFITDETTKSTVIVDPGANARKLLDTVSKQELQVKAILLTHGHFDHMTAANDVKQALNIPIYACEKEVPLLETPFMNLSDPYLKEPVSLTPDITVKDKDVITIDNFSFEVIETPGHTAGSVSYYMKKEAVLLSGDTLFHFSTGRTDFVTGSETAMRDSIFNKLFVLPKGTHVYPGHDEDFILQNA